MRKYWERKIEMKYKRLKKIFFFQFAVVILQFPYFLERQSSFAHSFCYDERYLYRTGLLRCSISRRRVGTVQGVSCE